MSGLVICRKAVKKESSGIVKKGGSMRIYILGCRVLTRELSALIADCRNDIDIAWLPQGMHDTPVILHDQLEKALEELYRHIDKKMQKRVPDYIVLGYGLCSKSIVGLTARSIPLVAPRTEDCIGLFLGSQQRYLDYFSRYQGTYWLNSRWVEDCPDIDDDFEERLREEYMEQYEDEDTVDYLMDMHKESLRNYRYVGYIGTETFDDAREKEQARKFASRSGLDFFEKKGDNRILKKMVNGDFDEENFLIVPPGFRIEYSNGPERIIAVPAGK